MALIDQRILIPAPMATVWQVLANHETLPKWRRDCKAISILTMTSNGVGIRRRITPPKGKDFIEEFKAWYNGFGYEYQVMDSKQFKYNLVRLRLQATPDGTIVQWTFEFETKGFFVNLFGKRRRRARVESIMIESLRELRRYVMGMGVLMDDVYRTKASVQDAPDVEKRIAYGAKLFAEKEGKVDPGKVKLTPMGIIEEPPVTPEDTPSIPKVSPPSFIAQVAMDTKGATGTIQPDEAMLKTVLAGSTATPTSLDTILAKTEPPKTVEDTKPNAPIDVAELTKTKPALPDEPVQAGDSLATIIDTKVTPPALETIVATDDGKTQIPHKTEPPTPTPMTPVVTKPVEPAAKAPIPMTPVPIKPAEPAPTIAASAKADTQPKRPAELDQVIMTEPVQPDTEATTPSDEKRNTDTLSIWEVFGVNRPNVDGNAESTKESSPKEPTQERSLEPPLATKKPSSLEEWLASEEPPLPISASTTVQTIVRSSQKPANMMGLRKRQHQDLVHVRRPHKR